MTYTWLCQQIVDNRDRIKDSDILECGSLDVNGSIRQDVNEHNPAKYIGIDLYEGPSVDMTMDVNNLQFEEESFDIVITTEMLEHVENWHKAMDEMKRVLKVGGLFMATTRMPGFPRHGYPSDYWRFDEKIFRAALPEFSIQDLTMDTIERGIFVTAIKETNKQYDYEYPIAHPVEFEHEVYSLATDENSDPDGIVYWGTAPKEKKRLFRRKK
jgi:SAM-dependent methyltransferase